MHRHILTGAPGTGKSTLLAVLSDEYAISGEPAREILAERRAEDEGSSRELPEELFVELILQRSIDKHDKVPQNRPVLFDRGVPDCVAYARYLGVDPAAAVEAAARYRYAEQVFLAPPWEAIYTTDDERRMTFAQVLDFHKAVVGAYTEAGYDLVELELSAIEDRAAFIRGRLHST